MPKTRFTINVVDDKTLNLIKKIPEAGCLHSCRRFVYSESEVRQVLLNLLSESGGSANVVVERQDFMDERDEADATRHESGMGYLPVISRTLLAAKIKFGADGKNFVLA